MRRYEQRPVNHTTTVLVDQHCDLCGDDMLPGRNRGDDTVTIEKCTVSFDGCVEEKHFIDCCADCWDHKVVPFIHCMTGGGPHIKEYD